MKQTLPQNYKIKATNYTKHALGNTYDFVYPNEFLQSM